jgi:hypothetical protein
MPRGREEKRKARPGVSHGVVCSGGGDCMTVRLVVEGLVDWLAARRAVVDGGPPL